MTNVTTHEKVEKMNTWSHKEMKVIEESSTFTLEKSSTDDRETPDGKRSGERQRRLHIIRKPTNPLEENHMTLAKCAPADQDANRRL